MTSRICICLPWFHPASGPLPLACARRLALGFSEGTESGTWLPDGYPLTPEEAAGFIGDLRRMQTADLECFRHALGAERAGARLQEQAERQALARFMGLDGGEDPLDMFRRHAHKMLLWLWRMEEQWAEARDLEARCAAAEAALRHNFSENDYAPLPEAGLAPSPLPGMWRVAVVHAALFVPLNMAIFAGGDMGAELMELFPFESMPQWGADVLGCSASLAQITGQSPPRALEPEEELFTTYYGNRLWLVLR